MASNAGSRTRLRQRLGRLTPELLLAHRELELLRVAARTPRSRSARRCHARHLSIRFKKLESAQRLVTTRCH
jgi:hypothetical protein